MTIRGKQTRRTDTGQGKTGLFKHEVSGNRWKQSGAGQTLMMAMAGKHTKGGSNRAWNERQEVRTK